MTNKPLTVLLYYKYTHIQNPTQLLQTQRTLCQNLNLKGRILIAHEGINGTIAGQPTAIQQYQTTLKSDPRFTNIEFKKTSGDTQTFPKLTIKTRPEIVTLGLTQNINPTQNAATHLTPQQWKTTLDQQKNNLTLLDIRNQYETTLGHFHNAIKPPINHFRDLPHCIHNYTHLKNQKILMYCTGGIRCEKASALFKQHGFQQIFQLHGGIIHYLQQIGRTHWRGDCFTFDQRIIIPDNFALAKKPIATCEHTGKPTRHLINCANPPCHRLFTVSKNALATHPEFKTCPRCQQTKTTKQKPTQPPTPKKTTT